MRTPCRVLTLMSAGSLLALSSGAWAADAAPDAGAQVSEVIVTAPRQEEKARTVQFKAPNLISVQAAETILKYPDFNAAEALGRMPGVSLSSDTGEGRFVQIRGIDANLDGATYGGIPLLNTNPGGTAAGGGGRAVEFDTIPTGAVDGIVVTYTLLPDHEAEGLGGSIELTPRSAANITRPFLDATVGWGYEPLHDHTGPFEGDVAAGLRFGFDDKGLVVENGPGSTGSPRAGFISNPTPFSFVIYGSRKDDRRAIDDLEEDYVDDGLAPSNAVSEYSLRRYDYHRRRFSYGGDFEFQPNEDHTYYVRANVAGYTESVHKNILDFTNLNAVEGATGSIPTVTGDPNAFLVTTQPVIQLTNEEEVHRNQIYAIGGVDRWGDVVLDYHGAYSRATFHERRDIVAQFAGPTVPITYDNVSTPNYPIFTFPGGANINDPSLYDLNGGELKNEQDYDVDEEWSGAANLTFPVHFIDSNDRVKVGFEVRLRDKTASEYDTKYKDLPDLYLDAPGLSGPALTYYDGHYTTGPEINLYAINALIGGGTLDMKGPNFNYGSYIAAKEDIYAGYVQYTTTIGKWGVLAGVRVEATDADYGGYVQSTDVNGDTTNTLLWRPTDYVNAFPTVQVRYDFAANLIARATYSTGIARPGFTQNTTAVAVDFSQSPVAVTEGNPNLKPTLGQNFDLSLEYYLPSGGIVSAALFDKEFQNYITPSIVNGTMSDPISQGQLANITTYVNIPSAYARGIQLDYHQKFAWLPQPLSGFGLDANLTLVDSHALEYTAAQTGAGAQYGLLPGTSPVTWNLAGFYEDHGVQVRLSAEYVGHSLFGLSGDGNLNTGFVSQAYDTIQDKRLTMDLTSSYHINKTWTVYFNAKNLLNTPLRYYEGSPDRPLQREFYDVTIEGGVRAHF